MIAAAGRDHGPAVFVLGPSAEDLLIADVIVGHRLPVDLVAVGAESGPLRSYLTRLYGFASDRIRVAETLKDALFGRKAWITAARGSVPAYEYEATYGLLRFNPLAEWTDAEVRSCDDAARLAA